MVTEKIIFLQMHNTILQRVITKCKNDRTFPPRIAGGEGVRTMIRCYLSKQLQKNIPREKAKNSH